MNECRYLFCPWPGFNSHPWRSISRDFSLPDHTLPTRPEPAWPKMAQSPLIGTSFFQESDILGKKLSNNAFALHVTLQRCRIVLV